MLPFIAEETACRAAQREWAGLAVRERLRPIRALRHLLVERADDLCAAAAADIGRPASEVLGTELLPAAAALKFLERRAARLLRPRRVPRRLTPVWLLGCRDAVHRRPWGVVGIIGTWNYPIYLNLGQIAQAVVAGNGVLWKPSENAPRTADLTHQLIVDAGFPRDLIAVLPATREGGAQLAEAAVDYMVFTGSDAVGRKLAARLGERLIPSTLELSGSDAMFVLDDADVATAAKAAWFGLALNRGQTCIAVRRIYVHQSKVDEFVRTLRPMVEASPPLSLLLAGQVEQARRIIAEARELGATVIGAECAHQEYPPPAISLRSMATSPTRGEVKTAALSTPPHLWGRSTPSASEAAGGRSDTSETPSHAAKEATAFPPTIVVGAGADAAIGREACFAPIAALVPFDSIHEALSLAARSPYGLSASIFSRNERQAEELASRIPAGSVVINDVIAPTAHPATPFGGRGASGWGVTQGPEGLLAMTIPQVVTVRRGAFRPHFDETQQPDPRTPGILRGLMQFTHGRRWRDWLGGIRQMWRAVRRR
ncbi:MAG TPA: aldehyde dehydrogenase family protein [Urbifossiella sp.]|nr:aldehyde dehydrogenase family protein [Urbifossiella sp.]